MSSLENDKDGKLLERLADYLLSLIPGFRTYRRLRTPSTDYDILCSVDGMSLDFRAEMGRYLICECKNWKKPADFTAISKFYSVLESAKCKGGIIFSKKGISGQGETKYAERELLKAFHRSGITVLVIDYSDIKKVSKGENLLAMLRSKYEKNRFDIV